MQNLLKAVSVVSVWCVLLAIVIYIDPETIRDILIPQLYLPMIIMVGITTAYTAGQWLAGWKLALLTSFVMLLTGVLLLL